MTGRDTRRDGQDARIADGKDLASLRADGPAAPGLPDLRPRGLQVSQPESDFLARLGPLLPTPRAAKRLVNLYRLVRISIPEAELTEFAGTGGGAPYQVVQVLLAILVGSPAAAARVFREIASGPADGDITTLLAKLGAENGEGNRGCAAISTVVKRLAQDTDLVTRTGEYQQWCPQLARYSFHTRELAAGLSGAVPGK